MLKTRLLPRSGCRHSARDVRGVVVVPCRAGERECCVLPTCGRLASVSCRTLSPGRWPLSWSCSVPPHWCSPPRHQPAAWKAGSLLYLPLQSAQEREKAMVRHACHSLAVTCRAQHALLSKRQGLPAPKSALRLRNVSSLCPPAFSKDNACLAYFVCMEYRDKQQNKFCQETSLWISQKSFWYLEAVIASKMVMEHLLIRAPQHEPKGQAWIRRPLMWFSGSGSSVWSNCLVNNSLLLTGQQQSRCTQVYAVSNIQQLCRVFQLGISKNSIKGSRKLF